MLEMNANISSSQTRKKIEIYLKKYRINCLILNAAHLVNETFNKSNYEELKRILSINLIANTEIAHSYLKTDTSVPQEGKTLVLVSSTSAFMPTPGMALYGASKSYLSQFAINLALEEKYHKVKIICREIPGMRTQFQVRFGVKNPKSIFLLNPSKVAKVLVSDIAKDKSLIKGFGLTYHILHLMHKFTSRRLFIYIIGNIFEKIR
jgi:short-subunit dehydrogenase